MKQILVTIFYKLKKTSFIIINKVLNIIDNLIPKKSNIWILPVYFIGEGKFADNMLALYEQIKDDESITKIILTKTHTHIDKDFLSKTSIDIKINSLQAVYYLLKAKYIFTQHSVWLDLKDSIFQVVNFKNRKIINLWHGISIKDLSHPSTGIINERSLKEMLSYIMPVSSKQDKINMKKAFYNVRNHNFWITGLPRYDFMLVDKNKLPVSYKRQLKKLNEILMGSNLILYSPTYREIDKDGTYYEFSKEEISLIKESLRRTNSKLGLRYHPYRKPDFIKELIDDSLIIDLSTEVISDIGLLVRESKLVISDYSSIVLDCLYINRKVISFAYDYEHYNSTQRGFFYDFKNIIPTKIAYNFDDFLLSLKNIKINLDSDEKKEYIRIKKIFFKYIDSNNAKRVVEKVKQLD